MTLQHLRSSTANKRPTPAAMSDGQLAMNTNLASPGLFLKDSNGDLVKIGPVHVGTTAPNATPAVGGQAGNSKGEQWLDTTGGVYVFKIYDGTAWRSETGTFVDVNGDTMTGALGIIAGSAAAPSLFFSGDTNTGIYSPGADQVAVATNGTRRLDVNSSGQFRIGDGGTVGIFSAQAAANGNLHIRDIASVIGSGTGVALDVLNDAGSAVQDLAIRGTNTIFRNSAGETLRITSAGLVGIGTSSPNEALHIASGGARISSSLIGGGASSLGLDYESSNARFISYGPDVSTQTGLIFLTGNSTASTTIERLRITAAGNVGIGTSSPQAQLQVLDRIKISDSTQAQGSLQLGDGASTTFNVGLARWNGSANAPGAAGLGYFSQGTGNSGGHYFYTGDVAAGSQTARMIIAPGGNVGIGTTSPGQALDVVGIINSQNNATAIVHYQAQDTGAATDEKTWRVAQTNRTNKSLLLGISVNDAANTAYAPITITRSGTSLDNIQFATGNGSERARIDSSGRLLVGTSTARSTFYSTASAFIQIEGGAASGSESLAIVRNVNDIFGGSLILAKTRGTGDTIVTSGDTIGNVTWQGNDGSKFVQAARIEAQVDGTPGTNDMPGRLVFFTTADGQSTPTERMRIDALGALKTSPNGTYKFSVGTTEITHNDATSTVQLTASSTGFTGDATTISTYRNTVNDSYKFLSCIRQGFAVALEIRDDGDVYNVNGTYGSLSDVKLKENIVDANSQWDDIRQLRVRNYNFKPETNNSTHKQIGVIAQEIEDISPGLVNTVPDRDEDGNDLGTVTKSVNYSVLYMKSVKALQEAMERIETLETRLTAAGIE